MRWFLLLILSASAVWAQFPLPMPTRQTSFPLQRPSQSSEILSAWGYGISQAPSITDAVQISAGIRHALVLRQSGGIVGWGADWHGQTTVSPTIGNVVQVSAGSDYSVALRSDGTAVLWGMTQWSSLTSWQSPIEPSGFTNLVQVSSSHWHTLGLKADGNVVIHGGSYGGNLNIPPGLSGVVQVAAGFFHCVVLRDNGTVVAWGGQNIQSGYNFSRLNYGQADVPPDLANVVQVAAGEYHSAALKSNGTVVVWGSNESGQRDVPSDLSGVVSISSGARHVVAVRYDGTVVSWGDSGNNLAPPSGLPFVTQTSAGQGYTIALAEVQKPILVCEYPVGTALPSDAAPIVLPSTLLNNGGEIRIFTVRNSGNADLSNMVVSKSGADRSHFLLTAPATDSLAPGASTTFSVSFTPTSSGSRTAQLSITSSDTNNSPFIINLSGFGVGEDLDADGDGVNDHREAFDATDPQDPNSFKALSQGLVAHFPFNNSFADESGLGNDLVNRTEGIELSTGRSSRANAALLIKNKASASSAKNLEISGNQDNTIAFWYRSSSPGPDVTRYTSMVVGLGSLYSGWHVEGGRRWCMIGQEPSQDASVGFWGNWADGGVSLVGKGSLFLDSWHQVAFVHDGTITGTKIYIDGVLQTGGGYATKTDRLDIQPGPLLVGEWNWWDQGPVADRSISDLRIYNRALSSNEIKQLYIADTVVLDSDGDGVNDHREEKDGTNPDDPTSLNSLSRGLVAYYPFDGDMADESGFGRSGTISGSGITSSIDRFFGMGGAMKLPGNASDRAVIEPTPFDVNENFSLSFWCYGDPSGNGSYPNGTGFDRVDNIISTGLEFSDGLNIRYVSFQDPVWQVFAANFNLPQAQGWGGFDISEYVSQWSHIALVRSGSTWQTYFNGALVAEGDISRPISDMGALRIGTHTSGANEDGGYNMTGSIDDMRIYQRALSAVEIQKLFYSEAFSESQKSFLVSSPSIMGHYSQADYNGNRTNGQTDVTTSPSAFNLFTQSQFESNRTAGRSDVISNPMSYGLYTSDSIMDLRMGGLMIQKQGTDATIVFQTQTTTDLATQPFTNNGPPITNTIPMPGNKGFLRVGAVYVPAGDLIDVQTVDQGTGFSRSSGFTW